jgi:hypothetical protein
MNSNSSSTHQSKEKILPFLRKYFSNEAISKEAWSDSTLLFVPYSDQILISNDCGAEVLATILLLDSLKLKFEIEFKKNASEMSPSGLK